MSSELMPVNRLGADLLGDMRPFLRPVSLHGEQRLLPLEVWETDEAFVVRAEVPGVDPAKLEATLDGDRLVIKGERERPEVEGRLRIGEVPRGAFRRAVTFATPLAGEAIDAEVTHGILTIRVPKAEEAKPRRISIKTVNE